MRVGAYTIRELVGDKAKITRDDGTQVLVPASLIERGIMDAIDAGGLPVEDENGKECEVQDQ